MATFCAIGNDPVEPNRLTLNNGLQHADFYVGPPVQSVNASPVTNITEYLAKRKDSDDFVTLKVLTLSAAGDSAEDRHGKVLLHNEMLVLSLLHDQPGVVHHYGLFKDRNLLILVVDCLHSHEYDVRGRYRDFINLQHFVIQEKRLGEREALDLFFQLLTTVDALHRKNIVHRDLKLGNIIFNTRSRELTITNFALSKHLVREDEPLSDQRGSLAYISPDVLSGSPYCGKASDMWSMGVLLFTMLYGQFPFYDNEPQELFRKIRAASYTIPNEGHVTMETTLLIKQLIRLDAKTRLTASGALEAIQNRLSRLIIENIPEASQIVPDMEGMVGEDCMVPDHAADAGSALATPIDASVASNIHLTALRLSLSPQALSPEVFLGSAPTGTFGNMSSPVGSPNSLLLFPETIAYNASGNPFLCTASAHMQPFIASAGLSTSPQSLPGLSSLHMQSSNPSNSFPPPSYIHRIPLTFSLGTDYYHHHHPGTSTPPSLHQTASMVLLPSSNGMDLSRSQQDTPPGIPCVGSRHSSVDSELPNSPHLLQLPQTYQHHRRRNSSSSVEQAVRRYSQTTRSGSNGRQNGTETGGEQQRRRSHDVRAEQAELLESLRVAAAARRSSANHYIRVYGPQS